MKIVRTEGFSALYKGIGPTFISGAPYVGLQMTFYDVYKKHVSQYSDGILSKMLAGALAGITAQTITYPGDTVRRQMQSNGAGGEAPIYRNSMDCLVKIVKREGIVGLYRGLLINVARGVPGAAIQFTAYEQFKRLLRCE